LAKDSNVGVPMWAIAALIVSGLFNFLALFTIVMYAAAPRFAPFEVSPDVAIGLHVQLLETFLAALGIGLAIVGIVGFNVIRGAAVEAAEKAAERYYSAQRSPNPPVQSIETSQPDLGGPVAEAVTEPEENI